MEEDTDAQLLGISRRRVIKRGAIVGGAVWMAPVIDSFVTRAAATSGGACGPGAPP